MKNLIGILIAEAPVAYEMEFRQLNVFETEQFQVLIIDIDL